MRVGNVSWKRACVCVWVCVHAVGCACLCTYASVGMNVCLRVFLCVVCVSKLFRILILLCHQKPKEQWLKEDWS